MTKPNYQPSLEQVEALLAENGYEVTELNASTLSLRELESGVTLRAVLEDNILFLTVPCMSAPASAITPELMAKMLAADNGISTSSFALYRIGDDKVMVGLNNFCKLQNMGEEDADDVLSCVQFLLADVVEARDLLNGDAQ